MFWKRIGKWLTRNLQNSKKACTQMLKQLRQKTIRRFHPLNLGNPEPHRIADVRHHAHRLVPQGEGSGPPGSAGHDREIEVAPRHGDRPHQRLAVALKLWRGYVAPLHFSRSRIGQLSHFKSPLSQVSEKASGPLPSTQRRSRPRNRGAHRGRCRCRARGPNG